MKCRNCAVRRGSAGRGLCKPCYADPVILARFPREVRERQAGKPCRHCGANRCNRARGLCWVCYHTPGLREQYPPTSKYAARGVGSGFFAPPAAEPTDHPPGSPGKVAVLMGRARAGTALFHPDDYPFSPPVEKELAG